MQRPGERRVRRRRPRGPVAPPRPGSAAQELEDALRALVRLREHRLGGLLEDVVLGELVISSAMSASRMVLSAACVFWSIVATFAAAKSMRLCAAPIEPSAVFTVSIAPSTAVSRGGRAVDQVERVDAERRGAEVDARDRDQVVAALRVRAARADLERGVARARRSP
jgi:hypothetical protein